MESSADALIDAGLAAARAGDWPAFRARYAALSEACSALIEQDEALRQHFETLGAAAPQYDSEGCVASFEVLAARLRGQHATALRAARPPATPVRRRWWAMRCNAAGTCSCPTWARCSCTCR